MGGNTVTGPRAGRTPATEESSSQGKLDHLLAELSKLSAAERTEAVDALKGAGLRSLADALKAVIGGGSRPPERPASDHTPSD